MLALVVPGVAHPRAADLAAAGGALPSTRCCEFWAPEFHRLHGPHGWRWYVYSGTDDGNLVHHHIQVLESRRDDPWGPYHFQGILALGPDYEIDPTLERQFEEAPVVGSEGARSTRVIARDLVGGAGVSVSPTRPGGAVTYSIGLPASDRYRVLVRCCGGTVSGSVTLRIGRGRAVRRSITAGLLGLRELDFGVAELRAGRLQVRVTPGVRSLTLDQIRFVPSRDN